MSDDRPCVWIATPLRSFEHNGVLTQEAFESLAEHYKEPIKQLVSLKDLPWRIELFITGGGSVFRARNKFTSDFMRITKNPNDKLLMVDYDLMPTVHDYVRILSHNLEVVGGLYTIRANSGHWVMNKWNGCAPHPNGVLQVMELGTGFKCFKRSAFQKVLDKNPWLNCRSDFNHKERELGFFSAGPVWDKRMWPGDGRILTEDYWLDWLMREEEIPIAVDTKVKLRHLDEASGRIFPEVFPPDPGALPEENKEL